EKNASGFQRRTANEKDAALEFKRVLGLRIDDPHTADPACLRIEVEAVNDAVWADGEAAGFLRGGQRRIQAAEVRLGDAPTMANAAVVACGASLVDARENRRAADGHYAVLEMLGEGIAEIHFHASHLHRREEFSVRELRQAFGLAADAGKLFDVVVPGREVRIADRPIRSDSLFQVGLKVEIAPAIALPSPGDGFAADLAAANPGKVFSGGRGIGIVRVANKKLMGVFVARVVAFAL